jgi:hypothetical protein
MKDSYTKLTIQSFALLLIIGVAFLTSGFPLLLAVGISLLLFAARKETSTRNRVFSWTGSIIFLAAGVLIVISLIFFTKFGLSNLKQGIFSYNYRLPYWLMYLWGHSTLL